METIISTVSWLLKKVGEKMVDSVLGKVAHTALSKVGIFDAKCARCETVQSGVVIPENKQFTLECPKCGNAETIFIENVEKLIIRSIKQAIITIDSANVLMNSVSMPQLSSSTPLLTTDSKNQLQQFSANIIRTSPADEFQSLYGIVERKIVEKALQDAIRSVKNHADKYDLSSWAIQAYSICDIRVLAAQSGTNDLICPEIWIVPEYRKYIAKINAALQQSISESLTEIGLSLGKLVIRVFDERLPKK